MPELLLSADLGMATATLDLSPETRLCPATADPPGELLGTRARTLEGIPMPNPISALDVAAAPLAEGSV